MRGTGGKLILLALVFALSTADAWAQGGGAYPVKPIKLIVSLAAGGSNDMIARLFAQKLSEGLKQPLIVENRPGGNSIPATEYVAKSPPDGYTLLVRSSSLGIQPGLYSKLPYDTLRDLAPISIFCTSAAVLVVHPSVPARTVSELAAFARENPGKLNYASPAVGSPFHLAAELFKSRTGTDIVHVPYKGGAPAMVDLAAGRVQLIFANIMEILPYISTSKVRPLATTGVKRAAFLPDVPTIAEAGFKSMESFGWFALVVPRATPKEIIIRLHAEIVTAEAQPDVRKRLYDLGVEPLGNSPEEAELLIRDEIARWTKVIRESSIKLDE